MKINKIMPWFLSGALTLLFTVVFSGCMELLNEREGGDGEKVKDERSVGGFSALEIGGAFRVFLSQGDEESLILEADEAEIDEIYSEVVNGKLRIYVKPRWSGKFHKMSVYLTFKTLDFIDFGGAVNVTGNDVFRFGTLQMKVSGAAGVNLKFIADKLDMEVSGASKVRLDGECENGVIEISGASDYYSPGLIFNSLVLDASGASKVMTQVIGELKVSASGASSVRYKGNPKLSIDTSGAASVKEM